MRKIFMAIVAVVGLALLIGCQPKEVSNDDFIKDLGEKVNQVKQYKVDAKMEIKKAEGSVVYDMVIEYKEPDFYKVTLKNRENNNVQVILKNEAGVFVLTPALNKSFKFQSNWPTNSSHAYLIQSIYKDMINDSDSIVSSDSKYFYVENRVNHKANSKLLTQKVVFDKNTFMPKEATVFDNKREAAIVVTFGVFNLDPGLTKLDFDVEKTNLTARLELGEGEVNFTNKEILEPTYAPAGAYLDTETTTENKSIKYYNGELNYTVVQEFVEAATILSTDRLYGEPVMLNNTVAAATQNSLTWYNNGIEYMIFSTSLTLDEMVKIANSFVYGNNN